MADGKKGFLLYADMIGIVEHLPAEKAGELFLTILRYVNDQDPQPDDILVKVAFEPIKLSLKRDLQKWEEERHKRSNAGKLGGIKSGESRRTKQNEGVLQKSKQNEANEADNVSVNDNVNVSDSVNVKEKDKDKGNTSRFAPPHFHDVYAFMGELVHSEIAHDEANRFVDYYDSVGWQVGKKTMKDWQAAARGWLRRKGQFEQKKPVRKSMFEKNEW